MPEISVAAEKRTEGGTRPARRLRSAGKIPGVVYGHGADPISVAVEGRILRSALTTDAGLNALLDMKIGSERHLVVARELQRDPVKGTVTHVDFQIVRRDEVIAAEVPLTVVGEAVEVSRGDGRVEQQIFNLAIKALPSKIPTGLEVDISGLTIGAAIKVADLALPDGVTTEVDPEDTIVVGQPPRKIEAERPEGEEGEEGAAPAPAASPEGGAAGGSGDTGGEG